MFLDLFKKNNLTMEKSTLIHLKTQKKNQNK